jgi:hypothetical protein
VERAGEISFTRVIYGVTPFCSKCALPSEQ